MTIQVEGKSLELALVRATRQLQVTQAEVEHRIIKESQGLFGLFGKKVKIEAWKKGEQGPVLSEKETKALVEELRVFCEGVCNFLVETDVKVEADLQDGRLVLNVNSQDLANKLGRQSRLPEALEHLVRKKPKNMQRGLPFRVFVDVMNQRMEREAELVSMAQDLSNKVSENSRPIVLNYRSSYDRKVIHMALDKDERVYTKSIGSGNNRKLMILPAREDRRAEQA
ncbi:MAG: R3H domain-containing nucleic acid-binding protein [Oligoflexales bacterium]